MAVVFVWLAPVVRAQDVAPAVDLTSLSAELGSEDADTRSSAIERLRALPSSAVPQIAARLVQLRRGRPSREDADGALTAFRRATGSRRADDLVDIAAGVEPVLAERRDPATLRMAEPLLLLRSLEAIATTDALRLVPAVLGLDGEPWRMEGRRVTTRLGDAVAAAAILARADTDNPEGRAWARWTTDRLDLDNPGALAQRLAPGLLADVLRAYAATHTLSALPVVASFVDADQRGLREAAREALRAYRQNGIWVARDGFETRLGEEPDLRWGWERTLDELYARLDAARAAHVHAALEGAARTLDEGDTAGARALLDGALLRSPELATAEAAALYARIAEREPGSAPAALRRALAIAPDAPEAGGWRGRLAHLAARDALASDILDTERFAAAARMAPDCPACVADDQAFARQTAAPSSDRTLPLALAACLFALLGVMLLARPRPTPTPVAPERSHEDETTSPGLLSAEDTLA